MLRQILDEINSAGGAVSLAQLSGRLDAEPSAIEGMLEMLVRLGKLVETPLGGSCGGGGCSGCSCRRPRGRDGLSTMRAFVPTDR